MWIIVLFDLPTDTKATRREYTRFRKFLLKDGKVLDDNNTKNKVVSYPLTIKFEYLDDLFKIFSERTSYFWDI